MIEINWVRNNSKDYYCKAGNGIHVGFMETKYAATAACASLILGLCPANERRRYFVTTSLTGWAQT